MKNNFIIIFVMCGSRKEAQLIANTLLREKIVACANIIPGIQSKFWWKGKINKANETMLILKTIKANFKKAEARIKRLHSYDIPEIVAVPIAAGSSDYLNWIRSAVS